MIEKICHIKKYFTLLEIMIGTFLIGIFISIIGINLNKALHKHRFQSNINKFDNYVDFCKKMAFSNGADIYMHLFQKEHGIAIEIGTSPDMGFFKNIKKTKDIFDNMFFEFNGSPIDKLEIVFTSNGNSLTSGILTFKDIKKKIKKDVKRKI